MVVIQVRFLIRYGIKRVQVSQLKIKILILSNGAKSRNATDGSIPSLQQGICLNGEIGIRTGLRIQHRKVWEFESLFRHQSCKSSWFLVWINKILFWWSNLILLGFDSLTWLQCWYGRMDKGIFIRRKTSRIESWHYMLKSKRYWVIGIVDEKLENFCNKSSEETFLKHI